jgi:hypothetical protein
MNSVKVRSTIERRQAKRSQGTAERKQPNTKTKRKMVEWKRKEGRI